MIRSIWDITFDPDGTLPGCAGALIWRSPWGPQAGAANNGSLRNMVTSGGCVRRRDVIRRSAPYTR